MKTFQEKLESLPKERQQHIHKLTLELLEVLGTASRAYVLEPSPTSEHVLAFAKEMEKKLSQNRHKGDVAGWRNMGLSWLMLRLQEELGELAAVVADKFSDASDPPDEYAAQELISETADLANFAMMVADVGFQMYKRGPHHCSEAADEELQYTAGPQNVLVPYKGDFKQNPNNGDIFYPSGFRIGAKCVLRGDLNAGERKHNLRIELGAGRVVLDVVKPPNFEGWPADAVQIRAGRGHGVIDAKCLRSVYED